MQAGKTASGVRIPPLPQRLFEPNSFGENKRHGGGMRKPEDPKGSEAGSRAEPAGEDS